MKLKEFFEQNRKQFDIYDLKQGHEDRFLQKLKQHRQSPVKNSFIKRHYKKLLLAASVLILITLGGQYIKYNKQQHMKNTDIQQSEQYFSQIIKAEIAEIKVDETPETKKVFNDAMLQINQLETAYQKLVHDYKINHDKYILNAMIENFQQRIDILQFVKQEIQRIKKNKTHQNETHRA